MKDLRDDPATYWNEQAGPRWVTMQPQLDTFMKPVTDRLMEIADPQSDEDVIDIGCGFGSTALLLAERARSVRGVDISEPMLALARERAPDIPFVKADAQTFRFERSSADLVFSRFGVMFFHDTVAAFTNLCSALRPMGRCVFSTWQSRDKNPWMTQLVESFIRLEPPDMSGPNPFRFQDPTESARILTQAGFNDMTGASFETRLGIDGSPEELLAYWMKVGPLARTLAALDNDAARHDALGKVRKRIEQLHDGKGLYADAAVWIVTARL